jgi:hypothetical protein
LVPLKQKINCRSRKDTFNPEIEQQWQQNQNEISEEEFIHTLNFFGNLQHPAKPADNDQRHFDGNYEDLTDVEDFTKSEDDYNNEYEVLPQNDGQQSRKFGKRKQVSTCCHKLQRRAHRLWRQAANLEPKLSEIEEEETDHEWALLQKLEQFIENQKRELLKHGFQESDKETDGWNEQQEPEDDPAKETDDSLDDNDLAYITAILGSFSGPNSNLKKTNASNYAHFSPEGAPMQAQQKKPEFNQTFNQKFNQNSMSYDSEEGNFSIFSNFEEEGTTELAEYFSDDEDDQLADYFSDEEDDSLDKDPKSESDTWFHSNLDELGEISDEEDDNSNDEDACSEPRANKFGLKSIQETDYEEVSEKNNLQQISSISNISELDFSEWQPYISPEPVFRNSFAQSWQSAFSQPGILITGAYPHPDFNNQGSSR